MKKKVLISFDDSENAMRAVTFASELFEKSSEITLFNVLPDYKRVCEYDSPSLTPSFQKERASFCRLEDQKKALLEKTAEDLQTCLLLAGFEKNNLHVEMKSMEKGVARDIIKKADSGYDIVVLGKKGASGASEFFFGSVSQKVINGVKKASVLVVT